MQQSTDEQKTNGQIGKCPEHKIPLLVSACLLGQCCRYDGTANQDLRSELEPYFRMIPICPEQEGGLPTPRTPAERSGNRVLTRNGDDVTAMFEAGAAIAVLKAKRFGCRIVLLKERSPSCGEGQIYDGSFSGHLVIGDGVCAQRLKENGLTVFGETQIMDLIRFAMSYTI